MWLWHSIGQGQGPSCCSHLRCHSSFALQFCLVSFKGLLPAVLEFVTIVVFWETVLEGVASKEGSYDYLVRVKHLLRRRTLHDSVGTVLRCEGLLSCRAFQLGVDNVS